MKSGPPLATVCPWLYVYWVISPLPLQNFQFSLVRIYLLFKDQEIHRQNWLSLVT
jgi:hypothetical protein